jgi:general secretion pathway protein C
MQDRLQSNRAVFEQRTAQLEIQLRRFFALLSRIPLQRWQWLVMLLLVIWLSHSLARLLWLVVPTPEIPPASVSLLATEAEVTSGSADAVNIAQLKALAPFGDVAEAPSTEQAPAVVSDIEASTDTQLNLVLRGVFGSSTETAARAIIVAGDKADVYAVGDTLPVGNKVTLAKVLDIRVIINNNGNFESLWMYKDDPNAPRLTTSFSAPPASNVAPNRQPQSLNNDNNPVYDSPSPNQAAEPSMAEVTKTLADVVAMSIYREGGQVVGYKIRPGRNAEAFDSLGLQTDDIVTAVNGVPLSTPGKIMEIYKSMGSATSANLEIRRGGSTVNLDVMLK